MTDYICLWKAMLNEKKLLTRYEGRCTKCDGHDLLCCAYTPNDECSALEGINQEIRLSESPLSIILRSKQ